MEVIYINWVTWSITQVHYISNLYFHNELQMSHYIQVQLSWLTIPFADNLRLPKAAPMHPNVTIHILMQS